ncbi:MAG: 50S ribosomal protein L10 [Chloroflexi bacterium]|nr:MAG: 50S ribosomal protein L10 [Chloroflexota bacterium]
MAISKEEKVRRVALYKESISKSQGVIFTDYRGMNTAQLTELREQLKEAGGTFMVVKNNLLRIALKELGFPVPDDILKGPVALGLAYQDITQTAKNIVKYSDEFGFPTIKGGFLGSKLITIEEIQALAKLPPREVLLAQLVSGLQSPIYGLVNVLSGIIRSLMYVLQARARQLEGQSQA